MGESHLARIYSRRPRRARQCGQGQKCSQTELKSPPKNHGDQEPEEHQQQKHAHHCNRGKHGITFMPPTHLLLPKKCDFNSDILLASSVAKKFLYWCLLTCTTNLNEVCNFLRGGAILLNDASASNIY